MSINKIDFNPYVSTTDKTNFKSTATTNPYEGSVFNQYLNLPQDALILNTKQNKETKTSTELKQEIENTKKEQGLIGKAWNGLKNLTHIGAGSDKAEQAISDFENGKISEEEMIKAVEGYKEGQKQCVDLVADIVSGIAAFGTFALATGIGIAASPFTGGASLGLVAAGLGIAGAAGSATKVAVKGLDSLVGGRKYNSFGYDIATGGVNGLFAPVTAGIGGAAGKAVAGRLGVTAIREGQEIIVKESIKGTAKGTITKTLLNTNMKYVGKGKIAAYVADMAVNGGISSGIYSGTSYIAGDTKDKSLGGFAKEVGMGTLGGLVLSPVIGGGMRLAGNGIGKFTGKVQNKVSTNYEKVKIARSNTPIVENPDKELIASISSAAKGFQEIADDVNIVKYKEILSSIKNGEKQISELADDILKMNPNNVVENVDETVTKLTALRTNIQEIAEKLPDSSLYTQLGEMPEKATGLYQTLRAEALTLDSKALEIQDKILAGNVKEGMQDYIIYHQEVNAFKQKLEDEILNVQSSAARSGLDKSAIVLEQRLSKLTSSDKFQSMTKQEQLQAIVEETNILLPKFAQTFSKNKNLPAELQAVLEPFTSKCIVSRDLGQAQQLADKLYGANKYTLTNSLGAGTIGETYLAKTADGKDVVIKMLKEGVTPEKFAEDRAMFIKYIDEFVTDKTEKEYKTKLINSMFDAWDEELNFGNEAKAALAMMDGAERFSVAKPIEVGTQNGRNISLVMEKANGIELGKLLKMIEVYKKNPTEYYNKYAKQIEAYPALKNPQNWLSELETSYVKAQNEQTLFVGKSGTRTIHADPHTGNVFIDFDAVSGKPKIVFIDTGNVITRSNKETLKDLALSMNMMFGNSKGVAEGLLKGATLPEGSNRAEITKRFAELLDERLYKANIDLKNTEYSQNTINGIMKELNIIPDSSNSNLMKATLQRIETSRAIRAICGPASQGNILNAKDLLRGLWKSFKVSPKETWQLIKPVIKWAWKNPDQAMATFFQILV